MRLVLFDIDGTLVNSEAILLEAHRHAFGALGRPMPPRAVLLAHVGLSLPVYFEAVCGADAPIDRLCALYKEGWHAAMADPRFGDPLYDGAAELIQKLSRSGMLLGIATGKSRRGVELLLDRCGWRGLFATTQSADDAASKPAPEMILRALEETGVAAGDAVMVGDSPYDMQMARAAGIGAIGVGWGFHLADALQRAGAHRTVRDFAALEAVLLTDSRVAA